jgi:hypothetical protein
VGAYGHYLSGEMMVGSKLERVEDLDLYRPADFDGKVLQTALRPGGELVPYLGLVAARAFFREKFCTRRLPIPCGAPICAVNLMSLRFKP